MVDLEKLSFKVLVGLREFVGNFEELIVFVGKLGMGELIELFFAESILINNSKSGNLRYCKCYFS